MSVKKVSTPKKSKPMPKETKTSTPAVAVGPAETKPTVIKITCNPTGKYNLANDFGDVLTLSPELTKRMLDEGDAVIVK